MIFSSSLWGNGGASLGGSGLFSIFSPVLPSRSFLALSFSLTPPDVPVVPSLGSGRFLSSMTPSLLSGMRLPSMIVGSVGLSLITGRSLAGSSPSFFRRFSMSTKGPSCGLPSFPSTGASLVPTSYFLTCEDPDAPEESYAPWTVASVSLGISDEEDASAALAASEGMRRRRRGDRLCRSLIVILYWRTSVYTSLDGGRHLQGRQIEAQRN